VDAVRRLGSGPGNELDGMDHHSESHLERILNEYPDSSLVITPPGQGKKHYLPMKKQMSPTSLRPCQLLFCTEMEV